MKQSIPFQDVWGTYEYIQSFPNCVDYLHFCRLDGLACPKARLEAQQDLYYHLTRWNWGNWPSYCSGIKDTGPWIAIIGMRLQTCSGGDKCLDVLRALLFCFEPLGKDCTHRISDEKVTIGQALDQCYHRGVLKKPDSKNLIALKKQARLLMEAMNLISIWHRMNSSDFLVEITSLDAVRNMKITELCEHAYDSEAHVGRPSKSEHYSFESRELSLELLRKTGKLTIQWTDVLDEHLLLDMDQSILKIFWFGFSLRGRPCLQ